MESFHETDTGGASGAETGTGREGLEAQKQLVDQELEMVNKQALEMEQLVDQA